MTNIIARLIQMIALALIVLIQFADANASADALTWVTCMMAGIIVLIEFCKELKSS